MKGIGHFDEKTMTEEEALRKALDRERKRRRKAELLLEEKSRELFKSFEELEQTYAALKTNQKQLVHSEKMASLGIMSAGIAHEINNPVGFALSNIRSLQESMPDLCNVMSACRELLNRARSFPELAVRAAEIDADIVSTGIDYLLEDIPDLLSETDEGLVRIRDIVSGLKAFAKKDDSQRESVDINSIVRSAVLIAHGNIGSNVEVTETYQELPTIKASKTGLSQVMLNILQNAGDAVRENTGARARIDISTSLRGDLLCVTVSDTGCGMNSEQLDKLFTPFFTTKDVGKGTGLGLSASLGVVEEHGGRIEVESEVGLGSRFEVLLPKH